MGAAHIHSNGIIPRIDGRVGTFEIRHLKLVVPFELVLPTDARITNVIE